MDKKYNVSYTWNQPYRVLSHNPFYNTGFDHHIRVQQEMLLLNEIDRQVGLMDSYPDAEALIKNIFK